MDPSEIRTSVIPHADRTLWPCTKPSDPNNLGILIVIKPMNIRYNVLSSFNFGRALRMKLTDRHFFPIEPLVY